MRVSAANIRGTQNTEADSFSSKLQWDYWVQIKHSLVSKNFKYGNPKLDLFTSCINYQIERYISWKPVPKAVAIEVFPIQWNNEFCYIFLPFSLLGKETAWIYRDKTKAIVVIPKCPPTLMRKATRSMTITPPAKNLVQSQDPPKVHLLHQKLHLQVLLID